MRIGRSKIGIGTVFVCFITVAVQGLSAQTPPPKAPKTDVKPSPDVRVRPARPRVPEEPELVGGSRGVTEKAIAVDPNVNIKLPCISQARVTINGWQRNEVRIFVRNGSNINFKVHEKDPKSGKPVWLLITRQASPGPASPFSECISGDRIDIEVPFKASISMMGRETEPRIDSVKKVDIKNLGGNVALRNISGGIVAATYEGDVTVENSGGQISLETSTGNILAFEVGPGQIGETFRAKTSRGTITLQKVEHRQIEASSVSGTLLFNGKFLPGGIYNFKTSNGSVKLAIPASSSCRISASYGYGSIDSEIPMKIETENVSPGGKSLRAKIGDGDANLNLTTNSGSISITKQ